MYNIRRNLLTIVLATASILSMSVMNQASAATAEDLDKDSQQALQTLYKTDPLAEKLSRTAKAVLVFPNMVKAGLVFGGSYGEGELLEYVVGRKPVFLGSLHRRCAVNHDQTENG